MNNACKNDNSVFMSTFHEKLLVVFKQLLTRSVV